MSPHSDPQLDHMLHELWLLRQVHRLKRLCEQARSECIWTLHESLEQQIQATRSDLQQRDPVC